MRAEDRLIRKIFNEGPMNDDYVVDDYDRKVIALVSCPECGAQAGQSCATDDGPCHVRYELYARATDWLAGDDKNENWRWFGDQEQF